MVEILDGATLRRLLLERYSKNPKNWNFTISPARSDGFFDALVSSPGEAYQLKIDSIFKPTPLMLGTSVDVDHSKFSPSKQRLLWLQKTGSRNTHETAFNLGKCGKR